MGIPAYSPVANTRTSDLISLFRILSASGRPLSLKRTIPLSLMNSGHGARSICRPPVSAIGTCKMLERMSLSSDCSRYGALMYGIALFDLLKKTTLSVNHSMSFLLRGGLILLLEA
jgi:hypothetical protein